MNSLKKLVAKNVMNSPVVCISANEGASKAEQRLVDSRITGLPVVENDCLVGIITRSDFVRIPILLKAYDEYVSERRYEEGMQQEMQDEFTRFRDRLNTLRVRDVMTTDVVTCREDTPVEVVIEKMLNHHVHRVVVVDQDRPVGVVGSLDLVKLLKNQTK